MTVKSTIVFITSFCLSLMNTLSATAQDIPPVTTKPKVEYSPYLNDNYPDQVFWGDTHLHTSYSTDAGMVGNRLGPEDAYRFARGEEITSSTGTRARLQRRLDFLVIADHAENLGLAPAIAESNTLVTSDSWGKQLYDLVKEGKGTQAFDLWIKAMQSNKNPLPNEEFTRTFWERIVDAAELNNEPGKFTAFIGFEWTSAPIGANLHRNVIFRDGGDKAKQILPFSLYDSDDPEDLWRWMAKYEEKTGGRLLAIPHNGNLSNGLMFDVETLKTKKPLDKNYAIERSKWEPIYEVTQMKGTGETHPLLSPNDEFANFEIWDKGSFGPQAKTPEMLPKEYAREAYKRGLAYEQRFGVNPFKFGLVGSTDAHTSLSTAQENNYFGKVTPTEPGQYPARFDEIIIGRASPDPKAKIYAVEISASGMAAVWSRENTREALWDAMKRKETFGTTGTRLVVRVFAGWDFKPEEVNRPDFAKQGYQRGVPMGSDLRAASAGKVPVFMIRALRDPDGANLDRIQIIKGWLDAKGDEQERIYDVAVSDNRKIDTDGRCKTPVGNTVDVSAAMYTNSIGDPYLAAYWKDPDFDPKQRAFYYVRVLEIPTLRWQVYDARVYGVKLPETVPTSIQERAFTSPIWYTPGNTDNN